MRKLFSMLLTAVIVASVFSVGFEASALDVLYSQDFTDAKVNEAHPHFSGKGTVKAINGNNMLVNDFDGTLSSPWWTLQLKGDSASPLIPFEDFEYSYDIIFLQKHPTLAPSFGSFVRANANQNLTYNFSFRDKSIAILRNVGASSSDKILIKENTSYVFELNKKYAMKMVAEGTTLKWFIDGKLALEVEDETYSEGNFWFTFWGCQAAIDNVKIMGEKPVLEDEYVIPAEINLTPASMKMNVGETKQFKAVVYPTTAQDKGVEWISSDNLIATVDKDGNVKALKAGTARITARTVVGGVQKMVKVTIEGVTVTSTVSSAPQPSKFPLVPVLIGVGVVVLAGAGVGAFFVLKNKKSKTEAVESAEITGDSDKTE